MRLFIGIDLPPELKQAMRDLQVELRKLGVEGYWKSPENFHITLEFLGELDPKRVTSLKETLTRVVPSHRPFSLNIAGLGGFPSMRRPHTLWTAVSGNLSELNRLRDKIHADLVESGFNLEDRAFRPHITLASRPQLDGINTSAMLTRKLGEFTVNAVVLFESKVIEGRRRYLDLYMAKLSDVGTPQVL